MNMDYIFEQQNQSEKIVFQRSLYQMMMEDYIITDDLKEQLERHTYCFPSCLSEDSEYPEKQSILTRRQRNFSAKIHYIDTAVYFHKHDFLELIYVYRGECTHYIENIRNKIVLRENELILVNQNVVHAIGKTTKNDIILKMVLPPVFLENDFCYRTFADSDVRNFFMTALQAKNSYYGYMVFRNKNENCVKEYMEQILIEYFEQKPYYETAVKNMLSLMLIELIRRNLKCENEYHQLAERQTPVSDMLRDMEAYCEEMSLNWLAKKYGYNESYLSRILHQYTGKTFQQILSECRYKKAIHLLTGTDMPIELISEQCGYKNVNNLYRLLKRESGKSPMQIRCGQQDVI